MRPHSNLVLAQDLLIDTHIGPKIPALWLSCLKRLCPIIITDLLRQKQKAEGLSYALQGNVHLVENEGGDGMLHLADLIRAALARSGYNIPPRGFDSAKEKDLTHHNTR